MLRRLASGVGHLLLGGAIALILFGVLVLGVAVQLISLPYARISHRHAQLQALVRLGAALAAAVAAMRPPELDELDLDSTDELA